MLSTEFIITSLIVVLIPGTGVIYTISAGLFLGWRASIFAAFGCTVGIIPHLLASIMGLTAILHMSAIAFQVMKFIGVAYLLFLAWSMWQETGALKIEGENNNKGAWEIVVKGFLINILNPKLSLFFLAFLPQFVQPETESPTLNMLFLSSIFMGMTLFIFIIYGLFANSVRAYILRSQNVIKIAQRTFAVIFAMLGAKLAMTER
ncbi:MAG: LysE family translocator [Candidatus Thiodiazotropha sp. (ex Dulcina madagascariensis)]|nr:LysE family translocator [Candidatus Thiodiazotropha sp. (ex Dulcina madagascariensis)]